MTGKELDQFDHLSEDINQVADVRNMQLDLDKDEKLRATSLIFAVRYHVETIIKDPRYLELMMQREKEAKFSNDPSEKEEWHLRPTTVAKVIYIAQEIEAYLRGQRPGTVMTVGGEPIEPFGGFKPGPGDGGRAQGDPESDE